MRSLCTCHRERTSSSTLWPAKVYGIDVFGLLSLSCLLENTYNLFVTGFLLKEEAYSFKGVEILVVGLSPGVPA